MTLASKIKAFMSESANHASAWIEQPKYAYVVAAANMLYAVARAKDTHTDEREKVMMTLMGGLLVNWGPKSYARHWRSDIAAGLATLADADSVKRLREACRQVDQEDGIEWSDRKETQAE